MNYLEQSRKIVGLLIEGDSDNPGRVAHANRYFEGLLDNDLAMQAARAALKHNAVEAAKMRVHLRSLIAAATEVSRLGAVTGPQWSNLTGALIGARAAIGEHDRKREDLIDD